MNPSVVVIMETYCGLENADHRQLTTSSYTPPRRVADQALALARWG
jgi:hypothetical protein